MNYYEKYIKYKNKYLTLKKQLGGNKGSYPPKPCCLDNKKLIFAHGSMIGGTFIIPKDMNIITLTFLNSGCPLDTRFDERIKDFYIAGNTLFENNDKSDKLTKEGENFQFQSRLLSGNFNIKNHLGGTEANNQLLSFEGTGCNEGFDCNISCIIKNNDIGAGYVSEVVRAADTGGAAGGAGGAAIEIKKCDPKFKDNRISLKDLYYYQGQGTYIIIACRNFTKGLSPSMIKLAREISS